MFFFGLGFFCGGCQSQTTVIRWFLWGRNPNQWRKHNLPPVWHHSPPSIAAHGREGRRAGPELYRRAPACVLPGGDRRTSRKEVVTPGKLSRRLGSHQGILSDQGCLVIYLLMWGTGAPHPCASKENPPLPPPNQPRLVSVLNNDYSPRMSPSLNIYHHWISCFFTYLPLASCQGGMGS